MTSLIKGVVVMWLLVVGLTGCASKALPTSESQQQIIAACTNLVLDYALYRDQHRVEETAALFSLDARLVVQGQVFAGREAIRERMRTIHTGPKTRHMMSTIRITPVTADTATGISYVTVYAAPGAEGSIQTVDGFAIVGNYVDEFVLTDDGWKIANRRLDGAFRSVEAQ